MAAGLQDWVDFGVICALLLLNAAVGFIQEFQAGSIVDELKKTLALKAVVLRDGQLKELEAPQVVPGDILQVEEVSFHWMHTRDVEFIVFRALSFQLMAESLLKMPISKLINPLSLVNRSPSRSTRVISVLHRLLLSAVKLSLSLRTLVTGLSSVAQLPLSALLLLEPVTLLRCCTVLVPPYWFLSS